MALVRVKELSKHYGSVRGIERIQFDLNAGESMAIVGPNGSGKTTLVRCLLGLVEASEGIVDIAGRAYQPADPTRIGYLPEDRGHFQRDRVIDVLRLFGTLRGLDSRAADSQAHEYLEEMGLGSLAFTQIQALSNGQQQKVHLGITFMGNPDLLVLDEPTRGFDPVNKAAFNKYVAERTSRGATLILVTHQMQEVEDLTERILFLDNGAQHYLGTVHDAKTDLGETRTQFTYLGDLPSLITDWPLVRQGRGRAALIHTHSQGMPERLLSDLMNAGVRLTGFQTRSSTLDEVFVRTYGESVQVEDEITG
ncbi:ABC transporter ATP-binding protein [Pseudarthrobacter sp. NPDC055928]|uniref:ABC transporter ATP-binding protein n=1 Tax=Pseudarthrobacter sp. NPDC055928 TaxID=3345661 RepID=UPI0035DF2F64